MALIKENKNYQNRNKVGEENTNYICRKLNWMFVHNKFGRLFYFQEIPTMCIQFPASAVSHLILAYSIGTQSP